MLLLWISLALYLSAAIVQYSYREFTFQKVVNKTTWMPAGYVKEHYADLEGYGIILEDSIRGCAIKDPRKKTPVLMKNHLDNLVKKLHILSVIMPNATFMMFGYLAILAGCPPEGVCLICAIPVLFYTMFSFLFIGDDESLFCGSRNTLTRKLKHAIYERNLPEIETEALEYERDLLNDNIEKRKKKRLSAE